MSTSSFFFFPSHFFGNYVSPVFLIAIIIVYLRPSFQILAMRVTSFILNRDFIYYNIIMISLGFSLLLPFLSSASYVYGKRSFLALEYKQAGDNVFERPNHLFKFPVTLLWILSKTVAGTL